MLFPVLGRLKPGVTGAQARAAFDALIDALPDGPSREERSTWAIGILPLKELLVGFVQALVFTLLCAIFLKLICDHGDEHGHGEDGHH